MTRIAARRVFVQHASDAERVLANTDASHLDGLSNLYFLVIATAAATLWRSGLMEHLDRGWTLAMIAGAVMLGVLLRFLSRP